MFDARATQRSVARRNQTLFLIAVAVLILPVLAVRYVPLVDLPGHLGRLHILRHYTENPAFQQRYEIVGLPIPNMLIDLFTPLLAWLSMENVGRLFVVVCIVLFSAGCATLSRALFGVVTPLAVLAVFTQYNSMFFYGYAPFQGSVGFFLITLALWMKWRTHWNPWRLAAIAFLSLATYIAHLGGYAFLGLSAAFLILVDCLRTRRLNLPWLAGLAAMSPPVLLYLFAHGPHANATTIEWVSLSIKMRHAVIHLLGYNGIVDGSVAAALAVAALIAIRRGKVRIHPELGPLAALFWLLFAIFPYYIGGGPDADTRFVVGAGVLTLLALRVDIPKSAGRLALALALAALLFRTAYTGWVWTRQDQLIAEQVALFDRIPVAARVYPVVALSSEHYTAGLNQAKLERPMVHVLSWATVRRDVITPSNFTVKGLHYVFEKEGYWSREYDASAPSGSFDWDLVFRNYDFVWYFGPDDAILRQLAPHCEQIAETGKARLLRVVKPE